MTWQFDVNNGVLTTQDPIGSAVLGLVRLMVSSGAVSIVGSGDGIATFENTGQTAGPYDVLTGNTSAWNSLVANEFSNTGAWVRFRMTGKSLEFVIFRSTVASASGADDFIVRLSPTGFDSNNATANLPPTASAGDEQTILGTWPATPGAWGIYSNNYYWHAGCEDTPQDGFYPFYMFATVQGTQNVLMSIFFDPIQEKVGTDAHPWVLFSPFSTNSMTKSIISSSANTRGYRDYGGGGELFLNDIYGCTLDDGSGTLFPGLAPAQVGDNLARDMPIVWSRSSLGFYKGISRNIRWKGTNSRSYPDTVDLATATARIYVGDCLIPWKQNEVPL